MLRNRYIRSLLSKAQEEKQPEKAVSPVPAPSEPRHNYRITEDTLGVGGAKEKFRNNMAAINLLHELELENRLATPEEQEILSKYVGWGGLSMAFDETMRRGLMSSKSCMQVFPQKNTVRQWSPP